MSWEDIIKQDFDWDKEMKNIFLILKTLYVMNPERKADFDSITNSLHELEYFYERNKEKLQ